jgi:hypothetical protein
MKKYEKSRENNGIEYFQIGIFILLWDLWYHLLFHEWITRQYPSSSIHTQDVSWDLCKIRKHPLSCHSEKVNSSKGWREATLGCEGRICSETGKNWADASCLSMTKIRYCRDLSFYTHHTHRPTGVPEAVTENWFSKTHQVWECCGIHHIHPVQMDYYL